MTIRIAKLKKALKIYAKRLKLNEVPEVQEDLEREMASEDQNIMWMWEVGVLTLKKQKKHRV